MWGFWGHGNICWSAQWGVTYRCVFFTITSISSKRVWYTNSIQSDIQRHPPPISLCLCRLFYEVFDTSIWALSLQHTCLRLLAGSCLGAVMKHVIQYWSNICHVSWSSLIPSLWDHRSAWRHFDVLHNLSSLVVQLMELWLKTKKTFLSEPSWLYLWECCVVLQISRVLVGIVVQFR